MVIVVEIVDLGIRKPFLGGWRNTKTDIEYHNAMTQTLPREGKLPWESLITRDTQTKLELEKGTELPLDKSNQTYENGICIPSVSDKCLIVGKFEGAKLMRIKNAFNEGLTRLQYLELFAIKIQKFYRAYKTRSMIKHFSNVFRNLVKTNARFYRALDEEYGNGRPLQIIRSTSPKTRDDFEMLYNLVDRWRIGEIERANESFMRCSRVAAHAVILKKEIELLRAIDRIKMDVKRVKIESKNLDFLSKKARPISWTGYKGCKVSMETLRVQKAKEYKKLYEKLSRVEYQCEKRLALLIELRNFLKINHRCEPALETTYLIDQELCLISKKVRDKMLDSLRRRLNLAFLYLIKNERSCINSNCQNNLTNNYNDNDQTITRFCSRCEKLLSIQKFRSNRNQRVSVCLNCESREAKSGVRPVNEPYEEMLIRVRKYEAKCRDFDSVAFVIGPKGVRHLVEVIWHGKSGVSECGDINQLALVRFEKEKPWAPWNSLVLTKREANVHENLKDPEQVYSKNLVEKFFKKNLQARLTFKSLDIFRGKSKREEKLKLKEEEEEENSK